MPVDYKKYPSNWKEIRKKILERAKDRCENCGLENYATGYRDKNGDFHHCEGLALDAAVEDGERVFTIVLTIAHLNHCISDNRSENLKALCQRCHLHIDKDQHRANRWKNKYKNVPGLGI